MQQHIKRLQQQVLQIKEETLHAKQRATEQAKESQTIYKADIEKLRNDPDASHKESRHNMERDFAKGRRNLTYYVLTAMLSTLGLDNSH